MKKLLLTLLVLFSARVGAQIISENLGSKDMDDTRKITIVLPDGYDKRQKYPLFVVLNASQLLEPTVTSLRYFARTGEVPPSIIVGIYNQEDDVTIPQETGVPFNDTAVFFEFIGQVVIPHVQSKYATNGFKGIIADGEGANFINYYLLKENSLFNAYISLSPNMTEKITNSIPEQLASFKTPIFYYLGWTQDEDNVTLKKITDLDKLMSVKKLERSFYFSQPFPQVTTSAVSIMGISEALNLFFEEYRPITMREYAEKVLKIQSNTTQYLEDKYKKIKDLYGIDKEPLLEDVKAIYAAILKNADFESIPILVKYIKPYYKNTALPDYLEGDYYQRIQEPQKAFRSLQRAYGAKEIDFVTKELVSQTLEKLQKEYRGKLKAKKGDAVISEQPKEQPAETEDSSAQTPTEGQQ
ncbi:alpha/beta hydrolase-fold protein [Capnocytophaga gingivalis]|uniref:Esterase n=1 Tax=Capnocytophaga gingivalis TaxID=1017 RepID=A0ABU5Z5N7_9FLAO|nr:esterase [Capnocytophaga gingivalis]MEB3074234.1 esterase [Capnocytophaga gingivalis]